MSVMSFSKTLVTLLAIAVILSFMARAVSALLIDEYGQIYSSWDGQILGRESDGGGSSGSGSSGSGSSGPSNESEDDDVEDAIDQMERELNTLDTSVRINTGPGDIRTEIRFSNDTRVKTRVEDDRTRTDIYQGGTKVRLERRDGETRIKIENEETGEETDLPVEVDQDDEILEIRERAERDSVTVSTSGDRFVIQRNDVGALAHFPLSVDLSTNTLTVTTPRGERAVTILPDQAVQNMLAANVIDQVGGPAFTELAQQNPGLSLGQIVRLIQTQRGALAYEVPGVRQQRLLGFIPVTIETTVVVSAETGELLSTQSSLTNQLLDLVSF